jgi:hypothetical protein
MSPDDTAILCSESKYLRKIFSDILTLKDEATMSSLYITNPVTQHHIPEEQRPQKPKSHTLNSSDVFFISW